MTPEELGQKHAAELGEELRQHDVGVPQFKYLQQYAMAMQAALQELEDSDSEAEYESTATEESAGTLAEPAAQAPEETRPESDDDPPPNPMTTPITEDDSGL